MVGRPPNPANVAKNVEKELLHRAKCREDLTTWCIHAMRDSGQKPARHHQLIIEKLEALARGEIDRLLITCPPGHAKSTFASLLFPAWFLAQHPGLKIIGASHTQSLAEDISSKVRNVIQDNAKVLGYDVDPNSKSRERWKTTEKGEYLSASIGKKIAGARANVLMIDDPVGSRAEAESKVEQAALYSWYRVDALTRLLPGGRVVLIQTRWSDVDLAGMLLASERDEWTVINLPAIAEEDDQLGREPGEALWPEFYSLEALMRIKKGMTARDWSALYQQDPRPAEGSIFKTEFVRVDHSGKTGQAVRAWDLAASTVASSRGDWAVGVKLLKCSDGSFHIQDVIRFRGTPEEVEQVVLAAANMDGTNCTIAIPKDPGSAGVMVVRYLTRALAGFRVDASAETGDKATRAGPVASQANIGNLTIEAAEWNEVFIDELAGFPGGKHDDQVDALSRAFNVLMGKGGGPARFEHVGWLRR